MNSTIVDVIVIVILMLSTVFAWSRGLVREALSLLGWLLAFFLSVQFAHVLEPFISGLGFVQKYVDSCEIVTLISFILLFIISLVFMAIITPFFSDFVRNSRIGLLNAALGGFFGFLRGLIIILMIYIVYDTLIAASLGYDGIEESRSYQLFEQPRNSVQQALPTQDDDSNFIMKQFDHLTRKCSSGAING